MMQTHTEQADGRQPRINVWRLGRNVLLTLVLPCTIAIVVDILAGTWPIVTLVVAGFAFPIAGIVVVRSAMQELERVIRELAPAEAEESDIAEDTTAAIDV